MSAVAIITARGGSKRIPRKNVRPFLGRPIIAYSIEAALSSGLFDEVMVSTDDEEIAEVAREHKATVPFMRTASTANEFATTAEVIEEVLSTYAEAGRDFDYACCIYPTAPLLAVQDLAVALERLHSGMHDYVFSAGRFSYPVQRGFLATAEGRIGMLFPEHERTRSQDLPAVYHDAGQFYWGRSLAWLEKRPLLGKNTAFVELPPWRVQDIDTVEDWAMAERLATVMRSGEG